MKRHVPILVLVVTAALLCACGSLKQRPNQGESGDAGGGGEGGGGTLTCGATVEQGYYWYSSNDDYTCGSGYTFVSQVDSTLDIGGIPAEMNADCTLTVRDYSCTGTYGSGGISLTCDYCTYAISPVYGYGCEGGVQAGPYEITASPELYESPCASKVGSASQDGYSVTLADLEGFIDGKCAAGFSDDAGNTCFGAYYEDSFSLECNECTLVAATTSVESRRQLGVYELYSSSYRDACRNLTPGQVLRVFVTDAYVGDSGNIVGLLESSMVEAVDGGGNTIFSAPLNDDGTAQFSWRDQTADLLFDPFPPGSAYYDAMRINMSPSGCSYTYYP